MRGDAPHVAGNRGRFSDLLGQRAARGRAIDASSDLIGDLGLSSIEVMEIIEQVEEEFDISFPLNALPNESVAVAVKV